MEYQIYTDFNAFYEDAQIRQINKQLLSNL